VPARCRVELAPEALDHAKAIQEWWLTNRPRAPDLFLHELRAAIRQLRRSPLSGKPYELPGVRPTRRLLLPGSRYQLYVADEGARLVRIYALWHTARGEDPQAPRQ